MNVFWRMYVNYEYFNFFEGNKNSWIYSHLKNIFLESEHGNNYKKLKRKRNQNIHFYPIRPNKLWNHRCENNKSYSETSGIFADIGYCSQFKIVI